MSKGIEVGPYNAHWPRQFDVEREKIAATLGTVAVRIDHNGSTSVPGLAAKPIIDIQISVRRLQPMEDYARGLVRLGYVHLPHPDDAFCPFFHRPNTWPHTHHVHVVQSGGDEECRTLAFRDYLREHASVARQYEDLKRFLAAQHNAADFSSQQAYAEAKGAFIEDVTQRALAQGYPHRIVRW